MTQKTTSLKELIRPNIGEIPPEEEESFAPDPGQDLTEHQLQYQLKSLEQRFQEIRDIHTLRLSYSKKLFTLAREWLLFVILVIICQGFTFWGFALSDKVLITFITSTTVTVLGLFVIVAKWMFPAEQKPQQQK